MIQIFKPKRIAGFSTPCRYCKKKVQSVKETIAIETGVVHWRRWNFHTECFVKFREQINEVNIFTVKER